ncbi:glyoxalase/bleomycin resistance protein/dioxygenase superfamily protein [Prauserella shujinwangii]|uniref:Glyoxalase/bleomycin resistance protein/dioxygenase superfamily protein n=1 Tax=Prauserella shujinwangii TaxID=1453103 RepID=A0A2T0LP63_9PSEU|nr:VOC family protein [Prauserella shujinwangii]PRX45023.1 glyoxalase/bleomycin resistance protein/dioxygenase superfamily protein [Prauserella shujinwangii]
MKGPLETAVLGVRTVSVPVTDQDRAIGFFVGVLGFEKRLDAPLPQLGARWIEVAPAGAVTSVALVAAKQGTPAADTGIRLTTSDAAAAHTELAARGVAVDPLLVWEGVPPMFTFRDPDGNTFQMIEETPA